MARRVYFALHYEDVKDFRANVVRMSWVTKPDREIAGFYDASLWEEAKKKGELGIKRLINSGLENTSVTAVLIGTETFSRRWVRYEIAKSFERGNGLIGIFIHNIPDKFKMTVQQGPNPFDYLHFQIDNYGNKIPLLEWNGQKWIEYNDTPVITTSNVSYNFGEVLKGQFSKIFPVYDWMNNDGYNNFANWVEQAAIKARK